MRTQPLTVYVGVVQVGPSARDVLNQAEPLAPTFVNMEAYRAFYWTGVKRGDTPITYTVRGGNDNGWQWSASGQITGMAGSWFRVVLKPPAPYSRYRLEVSGTPQLLQSKIVGLQEVEE